MLSCAALWSAGEAGEVDRLSRELAFGWGVGLPGRVWSAEAPVHVPAVAQDTNLPRGTAAAEAGVVGAYAVPVLREGRLAGVVEAFLRDEVPPPETAVSEIVRVAEALASEALEPPDAGEDGARDAERELQRRAAHQAAAVEFAHRALAGGALEPVMEESVRLLRATLGADLTSLLVFDTDHDRLVIRAGAGWEEGIVGSAVPAQRGSPAGYAAMRAEPVVVEDFSAEARLEAPSLLVEHGVVSSAAVPVVGPEGPLGALTAHSRTPRRFALENVNFMRTVANVVAAAILRLRAEDELRRAGALLDAIVAETTDAIFVKDSEGRLVFANAASAASLGSDPAGAIGRRPSELVPGLVDLADDELAVMASGEWRTTETEVELEGGRRWYSTARGPYRAAGGRVVGVIGIARDVTDRRLGERRAHVLAAAGQLLATATDVERALAETARLPVPELCDLCEVTLVGQDGTPRTVAIAARDDDLTAAMQELRARYPTDPSAQAGIAAVLRTGEPALMRDIDPDVLKAVAQDETHRRMVERLSVTSAMIAPLTARGRTFGTITMATVAGRPRLDESDLALGIEMAGRAALATDSARLFAERQETIDTLQRALLPPQLPAVPGLQLAAAFHAGREGLDVGGDFYDVLPCGDGWLVVVGDVCGRGAEAANITAVARHSIRGAAMYDRDPASILRSLNGALLQQPLDLRFCTVLCVHLRPAGNSFRARLANGGHPGALVTRRDGGAEVFDAPGTLIGVLPDAGVGEVSFSLGPGDCLVLYTDGLLDVRRAAGAVNALDLAETVARAAPAGAEAVASALAADAVTAAGARGLVDDVAVLALVVGESRDGDG